MRVAIYFYIIMKIVLEVHKMNNLTITDTESNTRYRYQKFKKHLFRYKGIYKVYLVDSQSIEILASNIDMLAVENIN